MKKASFIVYFILTISSCINKKEVHSELNSIIVLDTLKVNTSIVNLTWKSFPDYTPFYIGKPKDSIIIDRLFASYPVPTPPPIESDYYEDFDNDFLNYPYDTIEFKKQLENHPLTPYYYNSAVSNENYKSSFNENIEVFIDSTQIIKKRIYVIEDGINKGEHYVAAFPVFILNNSLDTVFIGSGASIGLKLEAINANGEWQPIEYNFKPHGWNQMLIPPKEIMLTSVSRIQGNFNTMLRLKLGNKYSNVIEGNINYRQFKNMFNKNGDYSEEYKRENKNKFNQNGMYVDFIPH